MNTILYVFVNNRSSSPTGCRGEQLHSSLCKALALNPNSVFWHYNQWLRSHLVLMRKTLVFFPCFTIQIMYSKQYFPNQPNHTTFNECMRRAKLVFFCCCVISWFQNPGDSLNGCHEHSSTGSTFWKAQDDIKGTFRASAVPWRNSLRFLESHPWTDIQNHLLRCFGYF